MSVAQPTGGLLQQLEALTPEEIDLVIAFVEFLHYQRNTQAQTQAQSSLKRKNLARLRGIAKPASGAESSDLLSDYDEVLANFGSAQVYEVRDV
jgi:hypothetical protein